jgi:hypothetical protein
MAVLPVHSDHAGGDCRKNENALQPLSENQNSLKPDWQKHVLASSGYLELGMFDAAALVLEEIAPEDKNRNEVLGARVNLYMAAKKWDMVVAVASHLVKVDSETAGWSDTFLLKLQRHRPFVLTPVSRDHPLDGLSRSGNEVNPVVKVYS